MNERLTDNEFHSKEQKERAIYVEEPRLQAIYDKCFEYENIDTNPTRLANIKKAFEIIRNKGVNVRNLIFYCFDSEYTYEDYVDMFNYCENYWELGEELLSREEFDLLKEILL